MVCIAITVINQKGGVGKTTVATVLAYGFAERGQRCLCVDLDPQGNMTYLLTGNMTFQTSALSVFNGEGITNTTQPTNDEHIDVCPSSPMLAAMTNTEPRTLANALASACERYDYIVIDTPPSLGLLTISALLAADSVIVPAIPDIFSVVGIAQLNQTIESVNQLRQDQPAHIDGIVLTRCNKRHRAKRETIQMLADIAQKLSTRVYKTSIPESTVIGEAQIARRSIFVHAKSHPAALACREFVSEAFPLN